MSTIDVTARHSMSHAAAQTAADELASDLARKFDIEYGWDGNDIHFERPGVHGQISVGEREIRVQAYLGFMLALMRGPIEAEIVRYLREELGCEV